MSIGVQYHVEGRADHDGGALEKSDLARITVDTTVQPKNVTFPTDAKLMLTAIRKLGGAAKKHGVPLRQSYVRAVMMAGRYAHAKQFKRAEGRLKFLRTRLGRLIRDVRRKTVDDPTLSKALTPPATTFSTPSATSSHERPVGSSAMKRCRSGVVWRRLRNRSSNRPFPRRGPTT